MKYLATEVVQPDQDCSRNTCGVNTQCQNDNCVCLPGFRGDPNGSGCQPECILNTECPNHMVCIQHKCQDPCVGTCSANAICEVIHHVPMCSCPEGMTGNAFSLCLETTRKYFFLLGNYNKNRISFDNNSWKHNFLAVIKSTPCQPSPCGPNSQCREVNNQAACSCIPGFIGTPPTCRPECTTNQECPGNLACINQKCVDPCVGTCGNNAKCTVVDHKPICVCLQQYTGNPFVACQIIIETSQAMLPTQTDPCQPSPCGPNAICQVREEIPSCTCLKDFVGSPPYCRPECISNSECPSNLACINQKCNDPCLNLCGTRAICNVISHTPQCVCETGYQGDPFTECRIIITSPAVIKETPAQPCQPSPCGLNAQCLEQNGVGACQCLPEYFGNPYDGCRPECVLNSDCPGNRACQQNRCQDPCPGICALNAQCTTLNHVPLCECLQGYNGDPYRMCQKLVERKKETNSLPCVNFTKYFLFS